MNFLLRRPALLALTFLVLSASASAQAPSPREQFPAAVEAFQKTPTPESALRVIQLFKQLNPAPAVPEEAREPFVMGATVLKGAADPVGASKAVDYFTKSLAVAPWFAEAWYNRALAHETAGNFDRAINDLNAYLAFDLPASDRREAQDKVYALKAKIELAAIKKAGEDKAAAAKAADTPQAREATLLKKVEGGRFVDDRNKAPPPHFSYSDILEIKGGTLYRSIRIHSMGSGNTRIISFYNHDQPGLYPAETVSFRDGAFTFTSFGITYVYRIRPDGQALLMRASNYRSNDPDTTIPKQ